MSHPSPSRCAWIIHSSSPSSTDRAGRAFFSAASPIPVSVVSVPHKFLVKLRVVAPAAEQFVVRPALHDFAVLQHENLVRVPHRGQSVSNYETGAALEQLLQRMLNERLGVRIDRARRFVKNE